MDYATGITTFQEEVADYKSDASQVGIQINLVPQSFNTIIGETAPCTPWTEVQHPQLRWLELQRPGFEPTGEPLFETGAGSNAGSYSNPTEDKLINETHTSSSLSVFDQYATYTAQQLPFIWMPNAYAVQAVTDKLANVAFNPLFTAPSTGTSPSNQTQEPRAIRAPPAPGDRGPRARITGRGRGSPREAR